MSDPFAVKDCALIAISTGTHAQNLRELRDRLETVHPACIYYHFWGGLLRPQFDEPEYMNDFAAWSWRSLHDTRLEPTNRAPNFLPGWNASLEHDGEVHQQALPPPTYLLPP